MNEIIFTLAFVLVAVTLVGHGIWVLVAWILRGGKPAGATQPAPAQHPTTCPRCGLPLSAANCVSCGWPVPVALSERRPLTALYSLSKQIKAAADAGVLDRAWAERLLAQITEEREKLAAGGAQPAPRAAPATPPAEDVIVAEAIEESPTAVEPRAPVPPASSPAPSAPRERELASPVPLHERAARYADRGADAPHAPAPPTPQAKASWGDWLAAFMEERNIRWGELIGGLLIICGSIALVISFWSEIDQRPLLKFLLFNGVTAGLFGVGFYSEHRWRLQTTSQGLLTIASLLVPLNFLAIAAFTSGPAANHPLTIGGEVFSAALFSALLYGAGRVLMPGGSLSLVLGVMIPSAAQLLVRRFAGPNAAPVALWGLAAIPLACYVLMNAWSLVRVDRRPLGEEETNSLFKFLGITSFAALLPLGLLLYKTGQPVVALREISVAVCLLGAVPLAVGLFVWQRLAGGGLIALRTAGTSVGVFGAFVSLAGLVVGWPDPASMLPAALAEFIVFTLVAWQFALPAAHLVAAACLTIGYLLGVYLFDGQIEWRGQDAATIAGALVSGHTSTLLTPLVLAYAGAAVAVWRSGGGRPWFATTRGMLAAACAALAAISTALVTRFGFGLDGDPVGATGVYLLYASGAFVLAARGRRGAIAWVGAVLLLAAVLQGVIYRYGAALDAEYAVLTAVLTYASLCSAIAVASRMGRWVIVESPLARVLFRAALATSLAAAAWLAWLAPTHTATFEAGYWLWLAALWLAMALATGWLGVWTLAQVTMVVATVCNVGAWLERYEWFQRSPRPWLDPWTLEAVGVALAILCLAWTAARFVCARIGRSRPAESRPARAAALLATPWLSGDRAVAAALVVLLVLLGAYAVVPGVEQEIAQPEAVSVSAAAQEDAESENALDAVAARGVPAIDKFELAGVPHDHAGQWGAWLLLAMLFVLVAFNSVQLRSQAWLLSLFVVGAVACPLVATRFEPEVAVASALRWTSTGFLLLASLPIWGRGWIAAVARRLGWPSWGGHRLAAQATTLVFVLALAAPVAMMLSIGLDAVLHSPRAGALWSQWRLVAVVCAVVVIASGALWTVATNSSSALPTERRRRWPTTVAALGLVLGIAPLVAVALYEVGVALAYQPIVGPEPASIFSRMGLAVSYGVPILVTALVLVGYALRERSSGFALAGGLVANATATAWYMLALPSGGFLLDAPQWIRLAQVNACAAAGYMLAWIALVVVDQRRRGAPRAIDGDAPLVTQAALAPALLMLPIGWEWFSLVLFPQGPPQQLSIMSAELADLWGWISLALAIAAAAATAWAAGRRLTMFGLTAGLIALATMAAAVASRWDVGNWVSYNTLLVGHVVIAALLLAVAWHDRRARAASAADESHDTPREVHGPLGWVADSANSVWIDLARIVLLVLSLRELFGNVLWWSVGGFAALAVSGAAAAWIYQRRRYLYDAAIMVNVAGTTAWLEANVLPGLGNLVYANVILLAAPVIVWLAIEQRSIVQRQFGARFEFAPAHRTAARLAIFVLGTMAAIGLFRDAVGQGPMNIAVWLPWTALGVTAFAALVCLWDTQARDSVARLYLLGLVASAMLVDGFDLSAPRLLATGNITIAAYALATSYLWSRRRGLRQLADRLRVPSHGDDEFAGLAWLVPCNLLLIGSVIGLTALTQLTEHDLATRLASSQAVLTQVVSVALLARGDRRGLLQTFALAIGAIGAVMLGWSWLDPGTTGTLLNSLVVMAAALALVAVLYGLGLAKLLRDTSDWLLPARQMTPWLAGLVAVSLGAILAEEIHEFAALGEVRIAWPAIAAVAATLAGLVAAALAAALLPGRDPLNMSERGRTLYVYGAEVLLALLFVHVRITMPWLFSGFFQQYWPLVVMAIAFVGVGFAELCRRYRQNVLAAPMENTGALLPVLPVLGFWITDTSVHYSLLLLTVGVLYAGLSIARRSFGFGVLAAIAANGGLWYFLNRQDGFGFLAHPQIWLIPPALCVLVAAYLNREQLTAAQMTTLRYFTSMSIYLSSTADIFINGVADAPWLPVVLAGLSLIGVLAGIALRVRAFLLLGTSFLGLALFTIIWYAAVDRDQTWIWFASVVIAGALIIAMFAVFEKKRQEVLKVFEQIKQWEA